MTIAKQLTHEAHSAEIIGMKQNTKYSDNVAPKETKLNKKQRNKGHHNVTENCSLSSNVWVKLYLIFNDAVLNEFLKH